MNYLGYVVAAYAVFVVVLLWDWIVPRIQLRQQLRMAGLRAARVTSHDKQDVDIPLSRE